MMALSVAVLDIVVDEGEVVDELQGQGHGHGLGGNAANGFAGEEAEGGPEALAGAAGVWGALGVNPPHVVAEREEEAGVSVLQ